MPVSEPSFIWVANLGMIAVFSVVLNRALLGLLRALPRRIVSMAVATNTQVFWMNRGQGIDPRNVYWLIVYDCRHVDLEIKGAVPKARNWIFIPYNWHTIPLENCIFDEQIATEPGGTYAVYVTARPQRRQNEIDVSASPQGILMIRVTMPEVRAAAVADRPTVRPISCRTVIGN
jgi:hypothetical protein